MIGAAGALRSSADRRGRPGRSIWHLGAPILETGADRSGDGVDLDHIHPDLFGLLGRDGLGQARETGLGRTPATSSPITPPAPA